MATFLCKTLWKPVELSAVYKTQPLHAATPSAMHHCLSVLCNPSQVYRMGSEAVNHLPFEAHWKICNYLQKPSFASTPLLCTHSFACVSLLSVFHHHKCHPATGSPLPLGSLGHCMAAWFLTAQVTSLSAESQANKYNTISSLLLLTRPGRLDQILLLALLIVLQAPFARENVEARGSSCKQAVIAGSPQTLG